MNQDRDYKVNIQLQHEGKRFNITLTKDGDLFAAFGEGFSNLQECACGFGEDPEQALLSYLEQYGKKPKFYTMIRDEAHPDGHRFEEVIEEQNDNL